MQVTNADFRSHCVMQQGLQRLFPKLTIISEEDSESIKCSDRSLFDLDPTVLHAANLPDEDVHVKDITVWIDPLDATQEYTGWLSYFNLLSKTVMEAIDFRGTVRVRYNNGVRSNQRICHHRSDS